jgi:predicted enzyme related to lactoylglutathione lyase
MADDLDALADRLAAAGAPVIWDDAIEERRRFYTADPWGNRIELISPPASRR